MSSANSVTSAAQQVPARFGDRFDPVLGLWSFGDQAHHSHGADMARLDRASSLPRNVARLVIAAQLGRLADEHVEAILGACHRLQCRDGGEFHGNFPWYAEQGAGRVGDTNAAFFVGLNLCILRLEFAAELSPAARATLDLIAADLTRWFEHAVAEREFHYPNKYLGDLACAWLLAESRSTAPSADLITASHAAIAYWRTEGWGWGEHLSDIYANVMFNQLGALLILGHHLPAEVRAGFTGLFSTLLATEAAFAGGPRVPALRSYAFTELKPRLAFIDSIVRWCDWSQAVELRDNSVVHFALGDFFARHDLLTLLPPPAAAADGVREVALPCLRGAVARAWVAPGARLGCVSHFPIMPEAEYPGWGLSWQSFPVAFASGATGWGFLRWRVREGDREIGHPAIERKLDRALPGATFPPLFGFTDARQCGSRLVAVRRMPRVALTWQALVDAVELVGFDPVEVEPAATADGGQRLLLRHQGHLWTLGHHPLVSAAQAEWTRHAAAPAWAVRWSQTELAAGARIAHLWWIAAGDVAAPKIRKRPQAGPHLREEGDSLWEIAWTTDTFTPWQLTLDLRRPLGDTFQAE